MLFVILWSSRKPITLRWRRGGSNRNTRPSHCSSDNIVAAMADEKAIGGASTAAAGLDVAAPVGSMATVTYGASRRFFRTKAAFASKRYDCTSLVVRRRRRNAASPLEDRIHAVASPVSASRTANASDRAP